MAIFDDGKERMASGLLRTTTGTADASLFVALFSANPGSDPSNSDITTNELTGGGYSRKAVTLDEDSTGEEVTNDTAVSWTFTSTRTIAYAAVCESGTRGTNDLLFGSVVSSVTVGNGDTYSFAIGAIDLSFS